MAIPSSLSAMALKRICTQASSSYTKYKRRVNVVPPLSLGSLKGILSSLKEARAQDLLKLAPYEALSQPLSDLSLEYLDECLNTLRDLYEEVLTNLSELIGTLETPEASVPASGQPNSSMSTSLVNSSMLIPSHAIPKFSGQFSDWPNFINRFKTIVDTAPHLSVLQKFQYLIDALDAKTQTIISHLEFREELYPVAMDLLTEEFYDPRRLANYHAKEIIRLPQLNSRSLSELTNFVDQLKLHFRSLEAAQGFNELEAIVISLLLSKLDKETSLQFERHFNHLPNRGVLPTVNHLIDFLRDQVKSARGAESHSLNETSRRQPASKFFRAGKTPLLATVAQDSPSSCPICREVNHALSQCPVFLSKVPVARYNWIKSKGWCINCLKVHHGSSCPSSGKCRRCKQHHHTLLHFGPRKAPSKFANWRSTTSPSAEPSRETPVKPPRASSPGTSASPSKPAPVPAVVAARNAPKGQHIMLLATTLVKLQAANGTHLVLRALVDSAAGASFITSRCVQTLRAKRWHSPLSVSGIGDAITTTKGICALDVATLSGAVVSPAHQFMILDKISVTTPAIPVDSAVFKAARHLVLADPTFDKPSNVDCILGADIAVQLFSGGTPVNLGSDMPTALPTPFGYILMGQAPVAPFQCESLRSRATSPSIIPALCAVPDPNLYSLVENFWLHEETPSVSLNMSPHDQVCEQYFANTAIRDSSGRYPLDWDTPLPGALCLQWQSLCTDIPILENVSLSRPFSSTTTGQYELHGFCDASAKGYAAVLYLIPGNTLSESLTLPALLCAKTRVAPLKTLSIPRLELCGSHLLASLTAHYVKLLANPLSIGAVHLWTDSQIVLHWVQMPPHQLKTFVANRVSQIQEWVPQATWHYVPSADNPADLASRGVSPSDLVNNELWWRGPLWLTTPERWPTHFCGPPEASNLELAPPSIVLHTIATKSTDMFDHISSWTTLLRVVKLILSWRYASRKDDPPALSAVVSAVCFYIQKTAFQDDINALKAGKLGSVRLQRLNPFFDSFDVIRVGGRLQHSSITSLSFPILLPKKHPLVDLLIDYYHVSYLHAGLNLLLSQLSTKFWILSARQAIRSRIFRCVVCFKAKPTHEVPTMGQLPAPRVTPSLTFAHTGVDYAGPFLIKASHVRKSIELKVYLCLFICFSTKAVHFELASDLSTSEFLDVLKRFIARRGCPAHLYSDCGTNFIGASTALKRALRSLRADPTYHDQIERFCFIKGISFHFNPPSAPHQGGLWERAVRSAKFHLYRLLSNQTPTYKTLNTLIIQIEGILNSRPLTPLSSDPHDFEALTPAHFLTGRSLLLPPEVDQAIAECSPRQLHFITRTIQSFWVRWKREYLPLISPRNKWIVDTPNLAIGDLVVIDDPNSPPLCWPLGRISEVYPGSDGVVRRIRVITARSTLVRPAHKVYKLPIY